MFVGQDAGALSHVVALSAASQAAGNWVWVIAVEGRSRAALRPCIGPARCL
jgi:hypothetical protein